MSTFRTAESLSDYDEKLVKEWIWLSGISRLLQFSKKKGNTSLLNIIMKVQIKIRINFWKNYPDNHVILQQGGDCEQERGRAREWDCIGITL